MPSLFRPHLEAAPLLQCGKTVGSQPVPWTRVLGGDPELEVSPPLTSPDEVLRLPGPDPPPPWLRAWGALGARSPAGWGLCER